MANMNHNTKPRRLLFVLIAIACMLGNEFVEGRKNVSMKRKELSKHKGTVKTIKSEDGDLIDCVDIYKQPAFDHPILKTHTIQMKPSSYPSGIKPLNSQDKIIQSWLKNGQCPQGTVPIRRTQKYDDHQAIPLIRHRTQLNHSFAANLHEYAQVTALDQKFYGAHASINVWNPLTLNQEFSVSQIWVASGAEGNYNTVEAGWMVYPQHYLDNQTRFFVYWTVSLLDHPLQLWIPINQLSAAIEACGRNPDIDCSVIYMEHIGCAAGDNYKSTGCYNLECPGFVQTSQKLVIGSAISPVSSYNGQQFDITITIQKDSGNWFLHLQDEVLGYWPGSIFTSLADSASIVTWGGEIVNTNPGGHHTSTQMGSGHFPREKYGKASYFRNLGVMLAPDTLTDPGTLKPDATNPSSYDIHVEENKTSDYGIHFYYGGPGLV